MQALKRTHGVVTGIVLLLATPVAGAAQSITSGTLSGKVVDQDSVPLFDAYARVTDAATGITRLAVTGRLGEFTLNFLDAGEYAVHVERIGYRPSRLEGVQVSAGGRLDVTVVLTPARPPVEQTDAVQWRGHTSDGGRPGLSRRFPLALATAVPDPRREFTEIARLASMTNAWLETEGLPARHSGFVVDGVPFASALHPNLPSLSLRAAAFPQSALADMELVTNGVDVEWSGHAGGYLSGVTRSGTRELSTTAFGTWSGDAVTSSRHFDPDAHNTVQGGLLITGSIIPDTATFAVGVEARRLETPMPRAWLPTTLDDEVLGVARETFGVDLDAYARSRLVRSEAVTGSARFDWQIGGSNRLRVRASMAEIPSSDLDPSAAWLAGLGAEMLGRDLTMGATLTTEFGEMYATELRVGYESSMRDYIADVVPMTRVVAGGFAFGTDPGMPGRFEQSTLRFGQNLHIRTAGHHVKLGQAFAAQSYDQTYARVRGGEFHFGDAAAFRDRRGSFVQSTGTLPVARFSVQEYGLYAQNSWLAAPGLELTTGVRFDIDALPADRVRHESEWYNRTGITNALNIRRRVWKVSPRFGLTWDVQEQGRWQVHVGAGIHHDTMDPAVLAELLTHDGRVEVRRGLGELGSWPAPPSASIAPGMGPRLAIIGPKFQPPRSTRVSAGVTHRVGEDTNVSASFALRQTDFLARRSDLNRLPVAAGTDQYGRPLYGTLVQQGQLLAAEPGSNRRFGDYDVVSAITSDGRSLYRGFTIGLDRRVGSGIGLFGGYTYSITTDNWIGRRHGPDSQLDPFPDVDENWADGTSDFDVPHRAALGAEMRIPGPLAPRVSAVYRYRSGYPFTPGFRAGVDVNGDGVGGNDPAFIDDALPGMVEQIAGWDCLRTQVGRFSERNACREPGVHSLDVRVGIELFRAGRYAAAVHVDGLNLLESDMGIYDHALYLISPTGQTTFNASTGRTDVPLTVNPNFGRLLVRHTPGRTLRLGVQVSY